MPGLANALAGVFDDSAIHDQAASHMDTSFADTNSTLEFREFYAAACPHCKHMTGAWESASDAYAATGGPVKFRAIECNDENWRPVGENADLCKNIPGFPTLKMFKGDQEIGEYQGGRTMEGFMSYAKSFETQAAPTQASLGLLGAAFAAASTFFFGEGASDEGAKAQQGPKANFL